LGRGGKVERGESGEEERGSRSGEGNGEEWVWQWRSQIGVRGLNPTLKPEKFKIAM